MLGGERTVARATLRDDLRPRGPVRFGLAQRMDGGRVVLEVQGELDALTTPRFATAVDEIVRRRDEDVLIDLTGLSFVDSTGLHILLNAQRRLTRAGRRSNIVCRPGPVWRVFELARLVETLGLLTPEQPVI